MIGAPERGQHFVSRFYLKKFVATDLQPRANKELWVADLLKREVGLRSPRSVAKHDYFYEASDPTFPLPRIEALLKAVEDRAACALKAIESDDPPADGVDAALFLFIALQVARTPFAREMMAAHLPTEDTHLATECDPTPRPRHPLMARFWDVAKHLEKNPRTPDAALLSTIVRAVRDLLPKLWRSEILPFEAPDGFAYITSDQPAMIYAHEGTSPEEARAGRGTVHVLFPHSPRFALIFCLDAEHCTATNVHTGLHVTQMNDLAIVSAHSQVYCSTRLLAEGALARARDLRTLRRIV